MADIMATFLLASLKRSGFLPEEAAADLLPGCRLLLSLVAAAYRGRRDVLLGVAIAAVPLGAGPEVVWPALNCCA